MLLFVSEATGSKHKCCVVCFAMHSQEYSIVKNSCSPITLILEVQGKIQLVIPHSDIVNISISFCLVSFVRLCGTFYRIFSDAKIISTRNGF